MATGHKLIVFGERDASMRAKAVKDIEQAAALAEWHLLNGQSATFNAAWNNALARGRGWKSRATQGHKALVARHPVLDDKSLWQT